MIYLLGIIALFSVIRMFVYKNKWADMKRICDNENSQISYLHSKLDKKDKEIYDLEELEIRNASYIETLELERQALNEEIKELKSLLKPKEDEKEAYKSKYSRIVHRSELC